jgi:hypothetical protein
VIRMVSFAMRGQPRVLLLASSSIADTDCSMSSIGRIFLSLWAAMVAKNVAVYEPAK